MKKPKHTHPDVSLKSHRAPHHPKIKTDGGRAHLNPIHYESHPYSAMEEFAKRLALHTDSNRTCHSYYRDIRLIHEYFGQDPATITEDQLRNYILHVKTVKEWRPKTIRQTAASARLFFVDMLGREDWTVFSQIKTKDHDELPVVLSREEVQGLLHHVRLRRYRTPLKLIYACGLRLSECLSLTVHDIRGQENKLWVRRGKGHKDRLVPIATPMIEDLRRYWQFHKHPLLIFPRAGRGQQSPDKVAEKMHQADAPMPYSSLQRLLLQARKELDLPGVSVHTLRHSYATHLVEAGASLHTVQSLLGHKQINTTMVYLHLTHQSEQNTLGLVEDLCRDLPR